MQTLEQTLTAIICSIALAIWWWARDFAIAGVMFDLAMLFVSFVVFGLSVSAIARLALNKLHIVDRPSMRSSHKIATVRGAGIFLMAVFIGFWWIWQATAHPTPFDGSAQSMWIGLGLLGVLTIASFIDDIMGLSAKIRLIIQIACCIAGIYWLGAPMIGAIAPWPLAMPYLWLGLCVIGWCGYTNFVNFMDGIDGITAIHIFMTMSGAFILWIQHDQPPLGGAMFLVLGGLLIGFLPVNFSAQKIFLGDSGSIPLGYITGAALFMLAIKTGLIAPLILVTYYLVDPVTTLIMRARAGKNLLEAHRDHAYQLPVARGRSHALVTGFIAIIHLILIVLALSARFAPFMSLSMAIAICVLAVYWLRRDFSWHKLSPNTKK